MDVGRKPSAVCRLSSEAVVNGHETTRIPLVERVECEVLQHVPVAQLDRASASGAEGYRFNSCRAYYPLLSSVLPECLQSLAVPGVPANPHSGAQACTIPL
jgi:hypothetical protein